MCLYFYIYDINLILFKLFIAIKYNDTIYSVVLNIKINTI